MAQTRFYGSQVGGKIVAPESYTGSPLKLLRADIYAAFKCILFLPYIVWPLKPQLSGPMCELNMSLKNGYDMFLHFILVLMQLPFLLSVPFWVFFPVWWIVLGSLGFFAVNGSICFLLNGSKLEHPSNPKYAQPKKEHAHEQWLFLNGVAVGRNWMQSNVDRLALTFGRPILGVHNKTNGILFDVLQCLIQRNFNYATDDVRSCYTIIKSTLYNPALTKVVFILHSQGAIEGGMIIDWLLQEVPQDLLAKLEVYTFGNAANHFNNPHLHLLSQQAAVDHPSAPTTTTTRASVHFHDAVSQAVNGSDPPKPAFSKQASTAGKTIRYIEHYAHTSDFVALWGVLAYTSSYTLSPSSPRFMGRVFERQGQGHQFNQHYLDNMFPLKKCSGDEKGIGESGWYGCDEDPGRNEFMDSTLELGVPKKDDDDEREGWEVSYLGCHGLPMGDQEKAVLIRDMSPISPVSLRGLRGKFDGTNGISKVVDEDGNGIDEGKVQFRVRDLSRLWMYVNGKSPKLDDVDISIARMATL